MISNILKVVHKINPGNMIIIRTKVDQHSQFNLRTVEEEKILDMKKVNDLLGRQFKHIVCHHIILSTIIIKNMIGKR